MLVFAHVLIAYILLVMPWVGRLKYRRLEQQLTAGILGARVHFYRLSVLQQLALTGLVVLFARQAFLPLKALGIALPESWTINRSLLITFTAAIGASIVLFRLTGDPFLRRLVKMAGALIPSTAAERVWFALVSVGAGTSEELLFRGFVLWYLNWFFHLPLLERIALSSLLFGYCHLYQGWLGVAGTTLVGAVIAWMYVVSGSLLLPITIHALIDLRILAIFTPKRMRSLKLHERRSE
jgi:membrane protease YdiL (CAAX protease family)